MVSFYLTHNRGAWYPPELQGPELGQQLLGQEARQGEPLGQQYAVVCVPPQEVVAELPPEYMQTDVPET
jgi:hypothetical protein